MVLSLCLLSAYQGQFVNEIKTESNKQGLVQVMTDVEKTNLNNVLQDLHRKSVKIIDIKLSDTKDTTGYVRTVYTVIYERIGKKNVKECLMQFSKLKDLKIWFLNIKKRGYGETGCGVIDKSNNTFYECKFGEHWSRVMQIVEEKHPRYASPLKLMYATHRIDEHNGVTRDEVEQFIFELVGEQKSLDEYV